MEFIDRTGHTFSLKSFGTYPIGHKTVQHKYIFWSEGYNKQRNLSVGMWYCTPIWVLLDDNEYLEDIEIESDRFKIVVYDQLQKLGISNGSVISTDFTISEKDLCTSTFIPSDSLYIRVGKKKVCALYVFALSEEEGTFTTPILFHTIYKDEEGESVEECFVPASIGGEWHAEEEDLIINGQNMGIKLPKEVMKAMYDTSYFDDVPDEVLWKRKMKEVLLEYMHIRGECGNYESAIDSLKWFGYGDKMEFTRLVRTDNQFLASYIHDSFDSDSDWIHSFDVFAESTWVSVCLRDNQETDDVDWQKWSEEFWGECKPFVEDLMMRVDSVKPDEGDITFFKPFYDWNFTELGLKMCWLAQCWKKYFLPVHLLVKSASMKHTVFTNDIKHTTNAFELKTAAPVMTWTDDTVRFSGSHNIYIYNQVHYIDSCFNEMSDYREIGENTEEDIYYIDDICASIPIWFESLNGDEHFYDVNIVLTREGTEILRTKFQFMQKKGQKKYNSLILSPKLISRESLPNQTYGISYWADKNYRLSVLCNGRWWHYEFKLKVPEMQLSLGTLEYQYYTTSDASDEESSMTFDEWLADNRIDRADIDDDSELNKELFENFITSRIDISQKSLFTQIDKIIDDDKHKEVVFNSFMYVPSLTEVNDINFYDKLSNAMSLESTSSATLTSYNEYLRYLASKCYIYNMSVLNMKDQWFRGNEVVPVFMLNNGIKTGTIGDDFWLDEFYVDCYFDIDTDNNCYASCTYPLKTIESIIEREKYVRVEEVHTYTEISDATLVSRKKALGLGDPVYSGYEDGRQYIDWSATPTEWKRFYIDDYEIQKKQCTVRLVWRGTVKSKVGISYKFGGYTKTSDPKEGYYHDIRLTINPDAKNQWCEMDCTCKAKNLCTFRKENQNLKDWKYDEDASVYDPAEGNQKIEEIMSSVVQSNLNSLLDQESVKYKIKDNPKYLVRFHVYDIYQEGSKRKKWEYEGEEGEALVPIYEKFFTEAGVPTVTLNGEDMPFEYDFYLMHDQKNWYGVFISQQPIMNALDDEDLEGPDEIMHYLPGYDPIDNPKLFFKLKRFRSENKFLLNRMMYVDASPSYKFGPDDIIVATIDNTRFPYIIDKASKWSVHPYSLGMHNIENLESTTNTCIFTIPDRMSANINGYYDVNVRYSLDGNTNQQQTKKRRILITDK